MSGARPGHHCTARRVGEAIADHQRDGASGVTPRYAATLCVSVNDEVVHGIPAGAGGRGDVVSIDCGAIVDDGRRLRVMLSSTAPRRMTSWAATTERAMWAGIALAVASDLGGGGGGGGRRRCRRVCRPERRRPGTGSSRETRWATGIGTSTHQPPDVLHPPAGDRGPRVGLGLGVVVSDGGPWERFTQILDDDGMNVMSYGSRASHWSTRSRSCRSASGCHGRDGKREDGLARALPSPPPRLVGARVTGQRPTDGYGDDGRHRASMLPSSVGDGWGGCGDCNGHGVQGAGLSSAGWRKVVVGRAPGRGGALCPPRYSSPAG